MSIYAGVLGHELGHCLGALHAKVMNEFDKNRGSVSWCDWEVNKNSPACNKDAAGRGFVEYGSPHTSMVKVPQPLGTQRPSSAPVPPQGAPRCVVALGGVCTLCALPEERGQPTMLCGRPVSALWVLEPAASTKPRREFIPRLWPFQVYFDGGRRE